MPKATLTDTRGQPSVSAAGKAAAARQAKRLISIGYKFNPDDVDAGIYKPKDAEYDDRRYALGVIEGAIAEAESQARIDNAPAVDDGGVRREAFDAGYRLGLADCQRPDASGAEYANASADDVKAAIASSAFDAGQRVGMDMGLKLARRAIEHACHAHGV